MKKLFVTKKDLEAEIEKLKDKLEFFEASEKEYKEEAESLRASLEAIKNGDCEPDAYCEHCAYGGKVEHRHLWSTSVDYVCLKNVACKQFEQKGDPNPQEGADNHD